MINSVNLEFLKPKLINMDKFNCPATTKLLPPSTLTQQTKTFVTITGQHCPTNLISDNQQQKEQQFVLSHKIINHHQQQQQHQERVRVQHLENHTNLQNNKCWNNYRTLNYTSASTAVKNLSDIKEDVKEIDVVNVEHLQKPNNNNMETPMNIQNKSAFNLELNNKKYLNNNDSIYGNNNNNNIDIKQETNNNNYNFYNKQQHQQQYGLINNKQIKTETQTSSTATVTSQRTEDQNNAYRHIESVHNYAKSKSYEENDYDNQSPNGSRHSSYLDDEEDDEEDDDEDDDEEVYNDDMDADYDEHLDTNLDDLDVDYEDIFNRRRHRRFQKLSTSSDGALSNNKYNNNTKLKAIDELRKTAQFVNVNKVQNVDCSNVNENNRKQEEEEEIHVDVDVETVESQSSPSLPVGATDSGVIEESANVSKPDHHARRPMNAFLIFCKRHRAIVKERYKNLENRAITKILGDWWASLDANDKKCFTNLAQQNKDAFFSANPNFKWYKLPAPPLRSLNTRPAYGQEYPDGDNETNNHEIISNNTRSCSNYFKLADEAQMGDLSQLMQDKTKNTNKSNNDLQQALGETSQFMSAHIQGNAGDVTMEENPLKRRYHNENSFSSNSSEDDLMEPKKKSARSCKGKRYQELINSGQITTVVKKSKATGRGGGGAHESLEMNTKQNFSNCNSFNSNLNTTNSCQKRSVSECDNLINYDLNGFDLEERIKELPALNLDDYLQRKRNTKKKKKFSSNGKKRGQRLGNSTTNTNNNNGNNNINNTSQSNNESNLVDKSKQTNENITQKIINKQPTAVGSQKRKARKESITRRDISAIEQEVASLLPLTINGCCYLQAIEKDTETITTPPQSLNVTTSSATTTSPIIPLQQNTSSSTVSVDIFNNNNDNNNISNNLKNTLNDNISSSTSDLLILAEVAANRTEL